MLFWLFIILIVIGIIMSCFDYGFGSLGESLAAISGVITAVFLVIIIAQSATSNSCLEINRERYKALVYKVENDRCRDESGLLSREVIDEVQDWNEDVRFYQSVQDDLWLGIFYPNIYDEFETIDYESLEKK